MWRGEEVFAELVKRKVVVLQQQHFLCISCRVYYKEAVGAFVVFDVTRQATFDAVKKWKQDLDSKVQLPDGSTIPCMLLANKVGTYTKVKILGYGH